MTATATAPAPTRALRPPPAPIRNRSHEVVGRDERIPLLDGRLVPYVNLDNAASTPAFQGVLDTVQRFLPYASSVHRGSGYKSRISTAAFERRRPASAGSWVPTPNATSSCSRRTRPKRSTSSRIARVGQRRGGPDDAARAPLQRTAVAGPPRTSHRLHPRPRRRHPRRGGPRPAPAGTRGPRCVACGDGRVERDRRAATGAPARGEGARRGWPHPGGRRAARAPPRSTCARTMTPDTSISSQCRRTSCTHRSGRARSWVRATRSPRGRSLRRRHDQLGHPRRRRMGRSPGSGGGRHAQRARCHRVRGGDIDPRRDRIRAHRRPRSRSHPTRVVTARRVPGVTVYGPTGPLAADPTRRLGVVSFAVEGLYDAYVAAVLGYEHGIGVRSGCSPCSRTSPICCGSTWANAHDGSTWRVATTIAALPASSASASVVTTTTPMSISRDRRARAGNRRRPRHVPRGA